MRQVTAMIEYGTSKIVCLIAEVSQYQSYNLLGSSVVEYAGYRNKKWLDPSNVAKATLKAISEAEKQAGRRIRSIHLGVPAQFTEVFCRKTRLDFGKSKRISPEDIEALYKKGEEFSFSKEYSVIHRCPIYFSIDGNHRTMDPVNTQASGLSALVSYILADRAFTGNIIRLLKDNGYEVATLISASYAQALTYIPSETRDRTAILIDVGHRTTAIMVVKGDGLLFHTTIPVGGYNITRDLMLTMGISEEMADQLKKRSIYGLTLNQDDFYEVSERNNYKLFRFNALQVQDVIEARMTEWSDIIEYVLEDSGCKLPDYIGVWLTGGMASMRGIREFVQKQLGRSTALIVPKTTSLNKSCYSSALSILDLAMQAVQEENLGFWSNLKSLFLN